MCKYPLSMHKELYKCNPNNAPKKTIPIYIVCVFSPTSLSVLSKSSSLLFSIDGNFISKSVNLSE